MFSLVSGVYDSYFAPTNLNVLVVGASGTGKTALLERLKVTQFTKKPKASNQQPVEQDVPESFLPVSLRVPQTQLQAQISTRSLRNKKKKQQAAAAAAGKTKQRRSFLACPAPSKYNKANDSSSDEEEDDDDGVNEDEAAAAVPPKPPQNGLGRHSSQDMSLEDVPIGESETSMGMSVGVTNANGKGIPRRDLEEESPEVEEDEEDQEYDLKSKARMLPLHKIRPTIGQNLGKVEMCGAQCRVWDVGGKMHDLWSRYYPDCDAVVFVWKIVDDSNESDKNNPTQQLASENNDGGDDSDEDDWPPVTAAQQLGLLETVRASIPDDVPFLIWGHWKPSPNSPTTQKPKGYQYDEPYSTASLLPHYHNPLMKVHFGSAKSGAGVRTAMEWLIPTATRQKRFRDKSAAAASEDDPKA